LQAAFYLNWLVGEQNVFSKDKMLDVLILHYKT